MSADPVAGAIPVGYLINNTTQNKVAVLSLTVFGTNESDAIAAYAVEP